MYITVNAAIDTIKSEFEYLKKENERLISKNKELLDEHYKDNELSRLKEENEKLKKDLVRGFSISEKEQEQINNWHKSHDCKYNNTKLKGISEYRFDIIPGIGYNAYVKCSCGKEFCFYEE